MTVLIESLDAGTGVLVDDRIERRQSRLYTPSAVHPSPADPDRLVYPVDSAATIRTTEVTLPQVPATYVRDSEGHVVAEVEHSTAREFEDGVYSVEVSGPIKLYLLVEGPVRVGMDTVQLTVELGREAEVLLGARSYHEHPATTITTTGDPLDVMAAVSHLGSALKTDTPDRSYPTLRGHPPAIELGDRLQVPSRLDRPETGTTIEVPPALGPAFVVAPLAYYLGATVEPGATARIVTETGFEHPLDGPRGFECEAARLLKQTFLLDCLTRMETIGNVRLHEREHLSPLVDLDFGSLSSSPPAERLEAYLDVPFELVEEHVPQWKLTGRVAPDPENVEIVPFLVDDLAVIRTPEASEASRSELQSTAVEEFVRGGALLRGGAAPTTRSRSECVPPPTIVEPEATDSLEQAWVGEHVPVGASKAMVEAYRNRLDREPSEGDIDIVVVCNDDEMLDEHDTVSDVYGSREELPYDVTLYDDLTAERLQLVLESDLAFFHYIGHIDRGGFQCSDGTLDVGALDAVGVDAFFLNACRSYGQGEALIERGAVGGVVTLDDIINSGAVRVGKTMARLLNRGFPLRAALNIASERSIVGGQYIVVGDGNVDIAHAESLTPYFCEIEPDDGGYRVVLRTYPTNHASLGTIFRPEIGDNDSYFLTSGDLEPFHVDAAELRTFLDLEEAPVRVGGEFAWSTAVELDR